LAALKAECDWNIFKLPSTHSQCCRHSPEVLTSENMNMTKGSCHVRVASLSNTFMYTTLFSSISNRLFFSKQDL
jgi:hypothetical protein